MTCTMVFVWLNCVLFVFLLWGVNGGLNYGRQERLLIEDDLLHTVQALAVKVDTLSNKVSQLQANGNSSADLKSVAFTAYLDHNRDGLGAEQPIVFDKTILNEGNGYNPITGIFTCSRPGLYLFSFFIGERYAGQEAWAHLVVDNHSEVDAVVDPFHDRQDLQGGNVALLRLKPGQSVWVKTSGAHIEGEANRKISTFSGVLIHN